MANVIPNYNDAASAGSRLTPAVKTEIEVIAQKSKVDGIEANADVTDAANVDAAGAVMNTDTSTAAMGFVIDEDTMSSDSDTKVPTQQSVKAYVLARIAALIGAAPAELDTWIELVSAIQADQSAISGINSTLSSKQPLHSALTAISALTPSNDDVLQRKGGVWTNRTVAQLWADLLTQGPRVSTTASSATPTINTDTTDIVGLTAQAVDITSMTTNLSGTGVDGQVLMVYIVGTASRAITWGTGFEDGAKPLPARTSGTRRLDVMLVYNAATSKWRCMDSSAPNYGVPAPLYLSGNYYLCNSQSQNASVNPAQGLMRSQPWKVTEPITLSKLWMELITAGEANSYVRLGIYADNGYMQPGALLIDCGTISTGSGNAGSVATGGTAGSYEIGCAITLQPGWYHPVCVPQNCSTTAPTVRGVSSTAPSAELPNFPLGTSLVTNTAGIGWSISGINGALPTPFGTPAGLTTTIPRLGFKVA